MLCVLVLSVYTVFGIFEFIPLYKQKLWRDFWVNMVLAGLSLITAMLLALEIKIPSPAYPIKDFITSIFGK